jgi:hypothetical protein
MTKKKFASFMRDMYQDEGLSGVASYYSRKVWEQRYWTTGLVTVTTPVLAGLEVLLAGLTPEESFVARAVSIPFSYPLNPVLIYGRERAQEIFNGKKTMLGKLKADTVTSLPLTVVVKGGLFGALYYAVGVDDPKKLAIAVGAAVAGSSFVWNAAFNMGDLFDGAFRLGNKRKRWAYAALATSLLLTYGVYHFNDAPEVVIDNNVVSHP